MDKDTGYTVNEYGMKYGIDSNGKEWVEIRLHGKMINLTNQRFFNLVALFPVKHHNRAMWFCQCDCGNEIVVSASNLISGNTKSCGCFKRAKASGRWDNFREEQIGKHFGRLTVAEFLGVKNHEAIYRFDCSCGGSLIATLHNVKSNNTQSCGCLVNEKLHNEHQMMIGKRFGSLVVISYIGQNKWYDAMYECLCDCEQTCIVSSNSLKTGNTQSCGCKRSVGENNIKQILDNKQILYQSQYCFTDLISEAGGYPSYDFAILDHNGDVVRLLEFDGNQHVRPYDYFGGKEKFLKVQKNDQLKNQYALSHNIPLVRIPYSLRDTMTLEDLMGEKYLIET